MTVSIYLSGGATNTNPELSLGGAKSTTLAYTTGTASNLFGIVNAAERAAGTIQYRMVYVQASTQSDALKLFVETETPLVTTMVGLAWAAAGINATEPAIANELTVPPGVTFEFVSTADPATSGGNFAADDFRGMWIRFEVQPGTPSITERFGLSYWVSNSAPVNTVLPSITGEPQEGSLLTAVTGSWLGTPSSYLYQWQESVDGNNVWTNINAANSVTMAATQVGKYVRVVIIARNANGDSDQVFSLPTAQISGTTPANTVLPVISGLTAAGSSLTTTDGTWLRTPTSFIYSWASSPNGVDWTVLSVTSVPTLALTAAHIGKTIRVSVVGVNAFGMGAAANSVAVGPVTDSSIVYVDGETVTVDTELLEVRDA